MATTLALTAVALAAALSLLAKSSTVRTWAMGSALVGAPFILLLNLWDSPSLVSIRDRPLLIVGAALAGAVVLFFGSRYFERNLKMVAPFAAAALPLRVPLQLGTGEPVNLLLPLYLVTGCAAIAWIRQQNKLAADGQEPISARPSTADFMLLAFPVLYALQSEWSPDQAKAAEQIAFFYVPFALLYTILRTIDWDIRLAKLSLKVSIAVAGILAIIGLVEYQTKHIFLNPKVIASNQIEDVFRVNSLFFDPNMFGRYLAIVLLACAAAALWNKRQTVAYMFLPIVILLFAGLVVTFSQTSFLTVLVGLAVLGAMWFGQWRAVTAVTATAVVSVVLLLAVPSLFNFKGFSSDSLDKATSGRVVLTGGGINLLADNPLLGVGSGGFAKSYRKNQDASLRQTVSASHTTPLTIAAEQGLVGLAAYLLLLIALFKRLFKDASISVPRAATVAMLAGLVFHTLSYSAFFEDPTLWFLAAMGLSLADIALPQGPRPLRFSLRKHQPRRNREAFDF